MIAINNNLILFLLLKNNQPFTGPNPPAKMIYKTKIYFDSPRQNET